MNYHKFGLHLVLFLGFGVWALVMFSPNACWAADLPKPLSYWRLDESSQPYKDFSNNNDGACIEENFDFCPERVSGIIDRAQLFDGVSEGLDIPGDSFNWSSTDSFSISFWMQRPDPPPPEGFINNEVIVGREDRVNKLLHWWVGVQQGTGGARFVLIDSSGFGNNENYFLLSSKILADGEWHHVVAVRDADQSKNLLYVDGILEDFVSISYKSDFASTSAKLNIGYLNAKLGRNPDPENAYYYSGTLDDVRIYTGALSETEIGDLFRLRPRRNMPWVPGILLEEN